MQPTSQPTTTPTAPPMSTTAKLGYATVALQLACLVAVVAVYLVEHLHPGVVEGGTGLTAAQALQAIGSIAIGGGAGGGAATVGHGVRHYGAAAPTTAQLMHPGGLVDTEAPNPANEP